MRTFKNSLDNDFQTQLTSKEAILDHVIIGAGFAGICMGIKLLEKNCDSFVILEKEAGVGGTWYKNTYPGAACDVPSHFYCYSFEPNPNWSQVYSSQQEIQAYIKKCADKYSVTPKIRLNSAVASAHFDDNTGLWMILLETGEKFLARHVIIGSGGLNTPLIPTIPGADQFKGSIFHTAQWPRNLQLDGKKIVVIGSAASAVQAVPEIAKTAAQVTMFQRTPNYVAPRDNKSYSDKDKAAFTHSGLKRRLTRWGYFWRFDGLLFPIFKKKSSFRARATKIILGHMRHIIKDPLLRKKLTPDYELGCKRILISDDFYPALNRENVSVITDGIDQITENGVTDKTGRHHPTDCIVLATGFSLHDQMTSLDIRGVNGKRLTDIWQDRPAAYRGAQVAGFPNLFFVTGPNTGAGSTSIVFMIEAQIHYILQCIKKTGQDKLIDVKPEAVEAHNKSIQKDLDGMVWSTGCKSWYKSADGFNYT
ncbi:MAG: NAD(P)/FAD-dependent oxidoreductase, partial [Sneathiella sp.]|nr:NAD(P)/FAD-dependent oxidoreductase [Sneathiella sp.]